MKFLEAMDALKVEAAKHGAVKKIVGDYAYRTVRRKRNGKHTYVKLWGCRKDGTLKITVSEQ